MIRYITLLVLSAVLFGTAIHAGVDHDSALGFTLLIILAAATLGTANLAWDFEQERRKHR